MKGESNIMKKIIKRLLTGILTLATVFTTLPVTQVYAADSVYTTTDGKAGTIVKVDNGGSEVKSFEESIMSADQISDVALNLEYVKQYSKTQRFSLKQTKTVTTAAVISMSVTDRT